jgi:signal transduction histidine kinase
MRAIRFNPAPFPQSTAQSYVLALGATAAALACRATFDSILGDYAPFLIIFPAVIFSAWYCGLGPSIASVIIASLGEMHLLFKPHRALAISRSAELLGAAVYLGTAAFIISLAEKNRRSMAEARSVHEALDGAVKERTRELEEKNTALAQQTEIVRELSGRLLQMRDEERRHIARELHDSVGQLATAVRINMHALIQESHVLSAGASRALTENMSLTDQLAREVRTISYLLHPPLLDELGLPSALRWFVEGFAQRSKIQVNLELQPDFGRLPRELEIHLFRIVQECLTNVHRHSGSATASIRLSHVTGRIRLELEDAGKGIPEEKLKSFESKGRLGVGISGMRERARQFGGTIEITSSAMGTRVVASIPAATVPSNVAQTSGSPLYPPLSSANNEARSRSAAVGERSA